MQLQGKFIAISVPALTIALVLMGGIVYSKLVRDKEKSLEIQMTTASERIDLQVDRMIRNMQTSTSLLTEAAPVVDWFNKAENSVPGSQIERKVRTLFEKVRDTQPIFREIRLVDADGYEKFRIANSTLLSQTHDERSSTWFAKHSLNPNADTLVSIASHENDDAPTVTVSSPVYKAFSDINNEKAVAGYVVIDVSAKNFAKNLSNVHMRDNGFIIFLNEDLDIVHAPDAHLEGAQMLRQYLLAKNIPLTQKGRIEQVVIDGRRCMLGQKIIRDGLIALIVSPPSTLDTIKNEIFRTVALATVTVIIFFSLFFSWLVRCIVVTPICRLRTHVTELSEGQSVSIQQPTRNDEIGQLARSFSHLNTQLSLSMEQLRETSLRNKILAYHDGLTGLPNRRHFKDLLNNTIENATDATSRCAVLFIDLNKFKLLNDTVGHQAGDELLIITGKRLQQTFIKLSEDVIQTHPNLVFDVARLSGDEFVVLISGFENTIFVSTAADRLIADLCHPAIVENTKWPLEASVGIALYPEHAADGKSLLACADLAMYEAKREQSSCWRLYTRNIGENPRSLAA